MLRSRTKHQITELLQSKLAIGESRHEAKNMAKNSLFDISFNDKIHSWNTYNTYKRELEHFASWVDETYQKSNFNNFDEYVKPYFDSLIDKGVPATSLKTKMSAVRKAFNKSFDEIKLPSVKRSDITRGRYVTRYGMGYSPTKNAELINFLTHTGLRRREVQSLQGQSIKVIDGEYYIHVSNGKGGKERDVYILNQDKAVIDLMMNTPADKLVWGHISKHIPIHNFRADYATSLYKQLERPLEQLSSDEIYHCRSDKVGQKYDKVAMRFVSNNLGHERINVIASNYLYVK